MATITTPDAVPGQPIEASWGDAVRADLNSLNTDVGTRMLKAGGAFTGAVTGPSFALTVAQTTGAATLTRKDYVDGLAAARLLLTGGRITGDLFIGAGDGYDTAGIRLDNGGQFLSCEATSGVSAAFTRIGAANAAGQGIIYFRRGTTIAGSITCGAASNAIAISETSDGRLKDDLGPIVDPTDKLLQLSPRTLRFTGDTVEFPGFIAQQVATVFPTLVYGDPQGDPNTAPLQLDIRPMIPVLVAGFAELEARVAALEGA